MATSWVVSLGRFESVFSQQLSPRRHIFWSPNDFYRYEMEHFAQTIAGVIVYCKPDPLQGSEPRSSTWIVGSTCETEPVIFGENEFIWFGRRISRGKESSQFLKHLRNNADPTWSAWKSFLSYLSAPRQRQLDRRDGSRLCSRIYSN